MELLRQAVRRARADEQLALATVVGVSGSTPRHLGAKMLIRSDGSIFGTIGGGRIEQEITAAGVEVARGGAARIVEHHLVRDLAMCCGGSMQLYVEPVGQSVEAIARAVKLWDQRAAALLITPLDGAPKVVDELGGFGGRAPSRQNDRFLEPIWPADRALLFGCGHVARAIGPLASSVGFHVVVCDDGDTGALEPHPEWADQVIGSFDRYDVEKQLGPLGPGDYVVILTRDHAIDQEVLEQLLGNDRLSYLGVIGSRGKIGRFRKRLFAKGVANDDSWSRLHAPIGLDIRAETPEEIAVSVVAELIAVRNGGRR